VRAALRQELKPRLAPRPAPAAAAAAALEVHEELFAALLIADPTLKDEPEARFRDELRPGALPVRVLLESERPLEGLPGLPETMRAGLERALGQIAATMGEPDSRKKALRDASLKMRLARLEERRQEKQQEINQAQTTGATEEEMVRLQGEHKELNELRVRLKQRTTEARAPAPALAKVGPA
jgi:hypothetical protein